MDTTWSVDLLGVVAAVVPVIGWILGDVFIWGPEQEAPGKVEAALLEKFSEPLADTARQVADRFAIDVIPTSAFLADVWFFDANMAVAAAAFAGTRQAEVRAVSHDVAYLSPRPDPERPHTNRRRPVAGHVLEPWQAGQLVAERLLTVPGHHAVRNPRATKASTGAATRTTPAPTTCWRERPPAVGDADARGGRRAAMLQEPPAIRRPVSDSSARAPMAADATRAATPLILPVAGGARHGPRGDRAPASLPPGRGRSVSGGLSGGFKVPADGAESRLLLRRWRRG